MSALDLTLDQTLQKLERVAIPLKRAHDALLTAAKEAEDYFDDRADTIDGDDGAAIPNKEAHLASTLRAAIRFAEAA